MREPFFIDHFSVLINEFLDILTFPHHTRKFFVIFWRANRDQDAKPCGFISKFTFCISMTPIRTAVPGLMMFSMSAASMGMFTIIPVNRELC